MFRTGTALPMTPHNDLSASPLPTRASFQAARNTPTPGEPSVYHNIAGLVVCVLTVIALIICAINDLPTT